MSVLTRKNLEVACDISTLVGVQIKSGSILDQELDKTLSPKNENASRNQSHKFF